MIAARRPGAHRLEGREARGPALLEHVVALAEVEGLAAAEVVPRQVRAAQSHARRPRAARNLGRGRVQVRRQGRHALARQVVEPRRGPRGPAPTATTAPTVRARSRGSNPHLHSWAVFRQQGGGIARRGMPTPATTDARHTAPGSAASGTATHPAGTTPGTTARAFCRPAPFGRVDRMQQSGQKRQRCQHVHANNSALRRSTSTRSARIRRDHASKFDTAVTSRPIDTGQFHRNLVPKAKACRQGRPTLRTEQHRLKQPSGRPRARSAPSLSRTSSLSGAFTERR